MSPATIEAYRIGQKGLVTLLTSEGIDRKNISFDCFNCKTLTAYAT
ncbi:MAG: hypothetical protein R2722_13595 [Tessaracoccus sp.]